MNLELFAQELDYPECPRWHDGSLWLSEMWAHAVVRLDGAGRREVVHELGRDEQPGGLGWLPGNQLVVVGMESRLLHRFGHTHFDQDDHHHDHSHQNQAGPATHADLGSVSPWALNDMVIGRTGTAYVSQVGFDLAGGRPSRPLTVDPGRPLRHRVGGR